MQTTVSLRMDGYTFRRSNSYFHFRRPSYWGSTFVKELEKILFFKSRPYFERAALSRKANRSQKLFPFLARLDEVLKEIMHYPRIPILFSNR